MYLDPTESGGSNYGSKYPRQFAAGILLVKSRQFAAGILLVAHHISSDQNALDLAAELSELFFCIKYDSLYGSKEPEQCATVHFFQFCVGQRSWLAYHYPLLF